MFDGPEKPAEQPPAPAAPHPLEIALTKRWNAWQLAAEDLAEVLTKITAAWHNDRVRLAEMEHRLAELEARVAKLDAAGPPKAPAPKPGAGPNGSRAEAP